MEQYTIHGKIVQEQRTVNVRCIHMMNMNKMMVLIGPQYHAFIQQAEEVRAAAREMICKVIKDHPTSKRFIMEFNSPTFDDPEYQILKLTAIVKTED